MSQLNKMRNIWIGTWRNKKGSIMRVTNCDVIQTGSSDNTEHFRVSGTFQTMAGKVPSQALFPMTGMVVNDQIGFSVSFRYRKNEERDGNSLTSWAGQILPVPGHEDKQTLRTLWNLVPDLTDGEFEDEYGWVLAWSGSDEFDKLSNDPDHDIV